MPHFIEYINIENFKSFSNFELVGCKKINLLVGKPNTGKSNILEALSLFSLPFLGENNSSKISHFIRVENEVELFYNGNKKQPIRINTNQGFGTIMCDQKKGLKVFLKTSNGEEEYIVDDKLRMRFGRNKGFLPSVRKYAFSSFPGFKKGHARYLIPPYGYNLLNVIEALPQIKEEVSNLFKEFDLKVSFDMANQLLKIGPPNININDTRFVPCNSIAGTLQRIIFLKTAIASNHGTTLLFDGPEAHCFPPFIAYFTQEMIYGKNNQYFISTHSPFIINDLLENSLEDLAIFIFSYEKHQTRIRQLSKNELQEIYQHGVDLFTNNESYI
jgi:AAA15 family ATPase/GTPase